MRIVPTVLAISLVVASGLAVHYSRQAEAARQRIAELDAQLQQRQAGVAASAGLQSAQPAPRMPAMVEVAEPVVTDKPPTEAAPAVPANVRGLTDLLGAQMSSPENLARRRETTRMLMHTSNPDLDEALGLAPEEAERVLELLATQQERSSAIFAEARSSSDPSAATRDAAPRLEEHRLRSQTEMQELLGSKYPQWQDYQQTRSVWQQRRDLRAVLDAAGTPLSDAQSQTLITALSAEQRSINQTPQAAVSPFSQYTPERQQRLLNAAAPHLTSEQLESYRQMLDRAAARDETMGSVFGGAAAAAAATEASQR